MPITWTGPLSFALYSLHHKARNFFLACATVDSVATRCSARLGLCKSLSSHTPCPEVLWIFFHYPPRIICIEYKQSTPLAKGKEHLQKQHDLAGSRAYQFGKLLCFIDVGPRQKQDFVTLEALDCATLWTVEVLRCMDLRWSYQLYGEDATINWTFWKRRAWRFENTRLWQDIWIKHFSSNFCKAVFAGFKIATITRGRRRHQGMPFTAGLRCLAGWKAMARFAAIIMNLVGYCSRSLCKLLRMI